MRAYSSSELAEIVKQLQAKHHEGDYWDFKQEWWDSKNPEMIKDILCFANTVHSRDCFIILGIENNNYTVVPFQKPRKKQADVLDTLSKVKFAGENIPDVSVYSDIPLDGGIVDVMVIHDSDRTPFYLSEDKQSLKRGRIYTRTGDRNTASDSNADPKNIELLWKKRFHLSQPVFSQFMKELQNPSNWEWTGEIDGCYHNTYRPEFTFAPDFNDSNRKFKEFYVELYPDKSASHTIYDCKYFGTVLKRVYTISMDGGKLCVPYPQTDLLKNNDTLRYFYMLEDSADMVVLHFLSHDSLYKDFYHERIFFEHVLLFHNLNEKLFFEQWLELNNKFFEETLNEEKKKHIPAFTYESFKTEYVVGKTLVYLLKTFRRTEKKHV